MDQCTDGTEQAIQERFPTVELINLDTISLPGISPLWGSTAGRAAGAQHARGNFVFFIDDDNVLQPDCIQTLLTEIKKHPKIGVVGPVLYRDQALTEPWCYGARLTKVDTISYRTRGPVPVDPMFPTVSTPCDFIPNSFLTRSEVLRTTAFDPLAFPHNWSELDWCIRVRLRGWEVRVALWAKCWHDSGYAGFTTRASVKLTADQARSRIWIRRRFPEEFRSQAWFYYIILPISSILYLKIALQSPNRLAIIKSYTSGTLAGVRYQVPQIPTTSIFSGGNSQ